MDAHNNAPLFATPATPTTPRLKRRPTVHASPYPVPESPCKPTSSLARRRRSSVISGASMSPIGGTGNGWEQRGNGEMGGVDEGFSRIAQAMSLLSLQPTTTASTTTPTANAPVPWPSPEELLKESLRQSLSALHALSRIKCLVEKSPSTPIEEQHGGTGGGRVGEVMAVYDRAVHEMRAAAEILTWAERHLSEEKEVVKERLLKG